MEPEPIPDPPKPTVETAAFLTGKIAPAVPNDDDGHAMYPAILEALMPKYRDGKLTRQPGAIRIKQLQSWWGITVVMPTERLQATIRVSSLLEAFDTLDKHLQKNDMPWEPIFDFDKKSKKPLPTVEDLLQ